MVKYFLFYKFHISTYLDLPISFSGHSIYESSLLLLISPLVIYVYFIKLILDNEMCPRTVKLLYYMLTNQSCYVTWFNNRSETFKIYNGVKQGGVISSLHFSIYIDYLFLELRTSGLGCHVGLTYAGVFGYADDIALIAPSIYSL